MARRKSKFDFIISYYVDRDCKIKTYSKRIYHSFSATYNNLYRYRNLCSLEIYENGDLQDFIFGEYEIQKFLLQVINGCII